jgi:predicted dehydrogenase
MRLRVGVIGLGRRWRRYRLVLSRLHAHVEVRAVCDQVARRAETVARRLRCAAAAGPVELLERADVEAVLLLDAQWYGLWPLAYAGRVQKPVFCAPALSGEATDADALFQQIQASGLSVLMALGPLLAPATRYLRELLTHRLGQARLVRADCCISPPREGLSQDLLRHAVVLPLLAGCAWLLDDWPRSVWTLEGEGASFLTLVLRFGGDRLAQVTLWTAAAGRTPARFELVAEAGTAMAELPHQLRWRDGDGQHAQRLPAHSRQQSALERFLIALRAGQPLRPSFADAYQAMTWQRAAVRSRNEGAAVNLPRLELASANTKEEGA